MSREYTIFSKILVILDINEIGLELVAWSLSPFLNSGLITAFLKADGHIPYSNILFIKIARGVAVMSFIICIIYSRCFALFQVTDYPDDFCSICRCKQRWLIDLITTVWKTFKCRFINFFSKFYSYICEMMIEWICYFFRFWN